MNVVTMRLDGPNKLRIRVGDQTGGHWVAATTTELEALIGALAKFRAQMPPEVPRTLGTVPDGIVDPIWAQVSNPSAAERVVPIRHPGIGWLTFLFSQEVARSLADYLRQGLPENGDHPRILQ
jgi:hypothetical protein